MATRKCMAEEEQSHDMPAAAAEPSVKRARISADEEVEDTEEVLE